MVEIGRKVERNQILREMSPTDKRLLVEGLREMIDNVSPSGVIEYIDSLTDSQLREFCEKAIREHPEVDEAYLERFKLVREALNVLKANDFPLYW